MKSTRRRFAPLGRLSLIWRLRLFLAALIAFITVFLLVLCNEVFSQSFINQLSDFSYNTLHNSVRIVDLIIKPYSRLTLQLMLNDEVQTILAVEPDTLASAVGTQRFKTITANLSDSMYAEGLVSLTAVSPKGKYSYGKESVAFEEKWFENAYYEKLRAQNGRFALLGAGTQLFVDGTREQVLIAGRLIKNEKFQEAGYVVVFISAKAIGRELKGIEFGGGHSLFFLLEGEQPFLTVGENGSLLEVAQANAGDAKFEFSQRGSRYAGFSVASGVFPYTVVNIAPLAVLTQGLNTIQRLTMGVAAAFMVLAFWVAARVSRAFVKPIDQIIQEVERLTFHKDAPLPSVYNPELNRLVNRLNEMLERISWLLSENEHEQQRRVKSEISMLMYQMNPHFTYNTLNLIRWLSIINHQPQIKSVVENFSLLLMNTMKIDSDVTSLEKEISFVESYISIMKVRYEAFDHEITVAAEHLALQVPKFIFQPLIENAILHGFRGIARRGHIAVRSRLDGATLVLEVADNGTGLNPTDAPASTSEAAGYKIGVSNVRQRIALRYGEGYGVALENAEGGGTIAIVTLPIIHQPVEGGEQTE